MKEWLKAGFYYEALSLSPRDSRKKILNTLLDLQETYRKQPELLDDLLQAQKILTTEKRRYDEWVLPCLDLIRLHLRANYGEKLEQAVIQARLIHSTEVWQRIAEIENNSAMIRKTADDFYSEIVEIIRQVPVYSNLAQAGQAFVRETLERVENFVPAAEMSQFRARLEKILFPRTVQICVAVLEQMNNPPQTTASIYKWMPTIKPANIEALLQKGEALQARIKASPIARWSELTLEFAKPMAEAELGESQSNAETLGNLELKEYQQLADKLKQKADPSAKRLTLALTKDVQAMIAGYDIVLWDTKKQKALRKLRGHLGQIIGLALVPGKSELISLENRPDQTPPLAIVWDLASFRMRGVFEY